MCLKRLNYYSALVPSRGNRTPCAWLPPKEVLCLHLYFGPQSKKSLSSLTLSLIQSLYSFGSALAPSLCCGHLLWILSFYLWDIRPHTCHLATSYLSGGDQGTFLDTSSCQAPSFHLPGWR